MTFRELCEIAVQAMHDLDADTISDEQRREIAAAWFAEQTRAVKLEALADTSHTDHVLTCLEMYLENLSGARAMLLAGAILESVVIAARNDTDEAISDFIAQRRAEYETCSH